MTALAANRLATQELLGQDLAAKLTVLASEICYSGGIAAVDYTDEVQAAADTAGLRVIGVFPLEVDNTVDGHTAEVERGIFRLANSSTYTIPRSAIGQACFVEDDQTVASYSTNRVPAGIIHDVDSVGVWVDMRPEALALARSMIPDQYVAKTGDYTVTAAIAFEGRSAFFCTKTGTLTITLPSAVAGMRVGVKRCSVTAADDVKVQCATGDKIQGSDALSAASKCVDNTVDAVSGVVWFRAVDDTIWALDNPLPLDVTSWVKNDA